MKTVTVGGYPYVFPEYVTFRGKKYEWTTSRTHFKDVAKVWAVSDRKRNLSVIVKGFPPDKHRGEKIPERFEKIYIIYRRKK